MRAPVVAGVGTGAGTSTLAAALHGRDAGTEVGGADVLVCRADAASLGRLGAFVLGRPGPVLAVLADPTAPEGAHVRLSVALSGLGPVTVLPHVATLPPPERIAALLSWPAQRLAPDLSAYADAVRALATDLVAGGALRSRRDRTLWRGLGPVERAATAVWQRHADDLDDDALEARLWPAAG